MDSDLSTQTKFCISPWYNPHSEYDKKIIGRDLGKYEYFEVDDPETFDTLQSNQYSQRNKIMIYQQWKRTGGSRVYYWFDHQTADRLAMSVNKGYCEELILICTTFEIGAIRHFADKVMEQADGASTKLKHLGFFWYFSGDDITDETDFPSEIIYTAEKLKLERITVLTGDFNQNTESLFVSAIQKAVDLQLNSLKLFEKDDAQTWPEFDTNTIKNSLTSSLEHTDSLDNTPLIDDGEENSAQNAEFLEYCISGNLPTVEKFFADHPNFDANFKHEDKQEHITLRQDQYGRRWIARHSRTIIETPLTASIFNSHEPLALFLINNRFTNFNQHVAYPHEYIENKHEFGVQTASRHACSLEFFHKTKRTQIINHNAITLAITHRDITLVKALIDKDPNNAAMLLERPSADDISASTSSFETGLHQAIRHDLPIKLLEKMFSAVTDIIEKETLHSLAGSEYDIRSDIKYPSIAYKMFTRIFPPRPRNLMYLINRFYQDDINCRDRIADTLGIVSNSAAEFRDNSRSGADIETSTDEAYLVKNARQLSKPAWTETENDLWNSAISDINSSTTLSETNSKELEDSLIIINKKFNFHESHGKMNAISVMLILTSIAFTSGWFVYLKSYGDERERCAAREENKDNPSNCDGSIVFSMSLFLVSITILPVFMFTIFYELCVLIYNSSSGFTPVHIRRINVPESCAEVSHVRQCLAKGVSIESEKVCQLLKIAIMTDNEDIVKLLLSRDIPITAEHFSTAIRHQRLQILDWLLTHANPTQEHLNLAARFEQTQILNRLIEEGLLPCEETFSEALKTKNAHMIDLLLTHERTTVTPRHIRICVNVNHSERLIHKLLGKNPVVQGFEPTWEYIVSQANTKQVASHMLESYYAQALTTEHEAQLEGGSPSL